MVSVFELQESYTMKIINKRFKFLTHSRQAVPTDLNKIIISFTDSKTLPFPSQRFPSSIENQLPALLMSGLLSAERELLIYYGKNSNYIAFTLCETKPENTVVILLAGVWPEFRGKGVFRQIIERSLLRYREHHMIVMCGPDMEIAERQLKRLGFSKMPNRPAGLIYRRKRVHNSYRIIT